MTSVINVAFYFWQLQIWTCGIWKIDQWYIKCPFVEIIAHSSWFATISVLGAGGYYYTCPGRWVVGWLPEFVECISLKPLGRFPLFKVLWSCQELKLCNVMIVWQFASCGLANVPKACQIWHQSGPDLEERIYPWNCLTYLLHPMFCEIVWAYSYAAL